MKTATRWCSGCAATLALAALLSSKPAAATPPAPDHLEWAEDLVIHVAPEDNTYGSSPSYVFWAGVGGATQYENRSVCSTFVTIVLKQAYGYTNDDFQGWFGSSSPTAAAYHDTIVDGIGFDRITVVSEIAAGDIVAIRYPEGLPVTGHIATARGPATPRVATDPLVTNTFQFELPVVDSSSTGHGPTDTRKLETGWHTGAGFGVMRLYADAQAEIVGYSWSTSSASTYHDLSERHLVVGRLNGS